MPRLFSYTIPYDDGAAPNSFRGMCTLAITKPQIRLSAGVGEWVLSLGSKNTPRGDLSRRMVYAMRVDQVLSLRDNDRLSPTHSPTRVPNGSSPIVADRLGDCTNDFSEGASRQQRGAHGRENMATDLPKNLTPLVHQIQVHKVNVNDPFVQPFLARIDSLGLEPNQLYGWPDGEQDWSSATHAGGKARCRPAAAEREE